MSESKWLNCECYGHDHGIVLEVDSYGDRLIWIQGTPPTFIPFWRRVRKAIAFVLGRAPFRWDCVMIRDSDVPVFKEWLDGP